MRLFEIDKLAEGALLEKNNFNPSDYDPEIIERIRDRIYDIPFDCTPNWGIYDLAEPTNDRRSNWYRRDDKIEARYQSRVGNVNFEVLTKIINNAVDDLSEGTASLKGFGIYGSYLYREAYSPPEDLDVLVLVDSESSLAIDALRYRSRLLKSAFLDPALPKPKTEDVGITMLSTDQFTPDNPSLIMTDAALLDTSTTYSTFGQVKAERVPPFVLNHNGAKVLRWGLSVVNDKPTSTLSRIDEALRMRTMLESDRPDIMLSEFDLNKYLPSSSEVLRGVEEREIAEIASIIIRLFQADEAIIREYEADRLPQK